MKEKEFYKLFPNASKVHFQEVDGDVLFDSSRKFDENDLLVDVNEPAFWDNEKNVKFLNLSFSDFAAYLLDKNNFLKSYRKLHSISDISKHKTLWEPVEWSFNSDYQIPDIYLKLQYIDFENFRIYVNDKDFFVLKDTLPDFSKVDKIDWKDSKNVYTLSLKIMYVLSYLGGIGIKNLKSENNLARTFAYFYFYYYLKKFWNYRDFSGYNLYPLEQFEYLNSLYSWTDHHVYYHSQIHYSENSLKRHKDDVIKDIRRDGRWMRYKVRSKKRDISHDYLRLITTEGSGITKIGQLLLQESNQVLVYSILGAQAKTHWKIIGDGANSLQTQNVFKTLVGEIIAFNNLSNLIKSMRIAISATKVRLNFCLSPGLELLPSDFVFIKDSPGYNNILLISSERQTFGKNSNVNNVMKRVKETVKESENDFKNIPQSDSQISSKDVSKDVSKNVHNNIYSQTGKNIARVNNTSVIVGSTLLAIVGRILWLAFF